MVDDEHETRRDLNTTMDEGKEPCATGDRPAKARARQGARLVTERCHPRCRDRVHTGHGLLGEQVIVTLNLGAVAISSGEQKVWSSTLLFLSCCRHVSHCRMPSFTWCLQGQFHMLTIWRHFLFEEVAIGSITTGRCSGVLRVVSMRPRSCC